MLEPPPGLRVEEDAHALVLSWPWQRKIGIGLLPGAIVLLIATVNLAADWNDPTDWPGGRADSTFQLLTVLCAFGAIVLGLFGAAFLLNRSYLRLDRKGLTVEDGPLRLIRRRRIQVDEIDRMRVVSGNMDGTIVHELRACRGPAEHHVLFAPNEEYARYLEHRIARWLG